MAVSIEKALALLAESGIELTAEQTKALADARQKEMIGDARAIVSKKVNEGTDAKKWTDRLFAFAEDFASDFAGQTVGRGRGEVFEQMVRIATPYGSLKVSLTNEPDEK